jgi:hypothetical protein
MSETLVVHVEHGTCGADTQNAGTMSAEAQATAAADDSG